MFKNPFIKTILPSLLLLAVVPILPFSSCASPPPPAPPAQAAQPAPPPAAVQPAAPPQLAVKPAFYRSPEQLARPLSEDEKSVLASSKTLMGKAPNAKVVVNGKTFVLDCIGTVAAIYYRLGIDITRDFARFPGNGVNRFYESLKARKALHNDGYPRPGDAVVWDNTWDANNDKNLDNDPRTHAGVVIAVEEDGTIHYVHEHVRRGVIVEVMNLKRPRDYQDEKGKMLNSPLALVSGTGRGRPEHWLAGDLWSGFGDVLREKEYYRVASDIGVDRALALLPSDAALAYR